MHHDHGREVVIVEAVRTPIGRGHPEKGYYKDTHPNDLLGKCYTEVIERAGIPPEEVEDVVAGCVQQIGEHNPDFLKFVAVCDIRPTNMRRIFEGDPKVPLRKGFRKIYGNHEFYALAADKYRVRDYESL